METSMLLVLLIECKDYPVSHSVDHVEGDPLKLHIHP
jgi:hypothetical protein